MKLALAQTNIYWEDKQKNIEKLISIVDECVASKVDLVLFPEMSLTGFSMNTKVTGEKANETVEQICDISKKKSISIGIGWVEATSSKAKNHYTIIDKMGKVLSDYEKIHPFSYSGEDEYFEGGDKLATCKLSEFCIGTTICYDLRFPELYQILSKQADLIIVPANWPAKRREHYMTLLKARAIETQCYIAGINCSGHVGDLDYTGDSALYDALGTELTPTILSENTTCGEKVLLFDISNDVSSIRSSFPVKNDRRETLYTSL